MKVALVADADWLKHEATLFRHLLYGLLDESVRAVPIIPFQSLPYALDLFSEIMHYTPSALPLINAWRVRMLGGKLKTQNIDLVHVLDSPLASAGVALGHMLNVPVVCGCWAADDAKHVAGRHAIHSVVVPTTAMAEVAQQKRNRGAAIEVARPGVMRFDNLPTPLSQSSQSLCLMIIVTGKIDPPTQALFEAISRLQRDHHVGQMQLFVYCTQDKPHRLWQLVRDLGLLGMLNLVGSDPGSQRLLMRADAVLQPQSLDKFRTVSLLAMGAGRPVIAAPSPTADYLIEDQTAKLVDDPTPEAWLAQLHSMIDQPLPLQEMAERAATYVRDCCGIASFSERMIDIYRRATGEPHHFPQTDDLVAADNDRGNAT